MKDYIKLFEEFDPLGPDEEDELSDMGFEPDYRTAQKTNQQIEDRIEAMLEVMPMNIDILPDTITVLVSGNELGYDDDQYYAYEWHIDDNRVESGTYKDSGLKRCIYAESWSEPVSSLKEFTDVINGTADGEWS